MRQSTKVERAAKKRAPAYVPTVAIDDAITWLSEHMGYPAPTREQFERRARGASAR